MSKFTVLLTFENDFFLQFYVPPHCALLIT